MNKEHNMIMVSMTEEEWVRLLNCAALAPFIQVQPLIHKITDQIVKQKQEESKQD